MVTRLNIDNSSQNKIAKEEKGNNSSIMDEHDQLGSSGHHMALSDHLNGSSNSENFYDFIDYF